MIYYDLVDSRVKNLAMFDYKLPCFIINYYVLLCFTILFHDFSYPVKHSSVAPPPLYFKGTFEKRLGERSMRG